MVRRAEPLAEWPIEKPVTDAGKRAAALFAAWSEQHERIAAVEGDYVAAQEALKAAGSTLETVLFEAAQTGKRGKAVADAEAEFTKAEQEANAPWQQRLEAPVRAAEAARAAYLQHITEHLGEVLSEPELADAAVSAQERVLDATAVQAKAFEEWHRVARAHSAIVKVADGITGREVPALGGVARQVCHAGERLLQAQGEANRFSAQPLPAPCVPKRDLEARRVKLGEAEVVEVEVDGVSGVQVIDKP